jgi:hypothetical protein
MGVFIGWVKSVHWSKVGLGGAHMLGWPGSHVSWPHRHRALDAMCTNQTRHTGKMKFEKAPTPSRLAKKVGPTSPTLALLGSGIVPHHPLVSYSL